MDNKKIILNLLLTISLLFSINSYAKIMINKNSAIRYELNDKNLVIFPSNTKNEYSLFAVIGERKKQQQLKLKKHNEHLMVQIPEDTLSLELKNESTLEFFTIIVEK